MKLFKKVSIGIVVVLFIMAVGLFFYAQRLQPEYAGEKLLSGLGDDVEVYYDDYGIPHIFAQTNADAYQALGYVHAQDRLWQMELMRRIAPGRLSEIFGEDLVETDKFFKTLGIHRMTKKEVAQFQSTQNKNLTEPVNAYLRGVNQFIAEGATPVEFLLLGIEKEPYTVADVYNVMGYIAFSFAQAQKIDPVMTKILHELGGAYLQDFDMDNHGTVERIKNYTTTDLTTSFSEKTHDILKAIPAPIWTGSNSWAVAPQKSATGSVIFANDPHMAISQPGVWYEAHIKTPSWERYGYHAALMPYALLLHNRQYAIGLTMFINDDVDFYFNASVTETIKEKILVKGGESVDIEVELTAQGPIVNDVLGNITDKPVALWWTFTQEEMESLEAIERINHGATMEEVRGGAAKIAAPGLNVMYGDADGNIAWWASGKLFLLGDSVNRSFILDATDSSHTTRAWLPFSENPQAENPSWNYVYSTNNQPDSIKGGLYPGYYTPDNRAQRIVDLLEEKEKISIKDYQAFLLDHTSYGFAKTAKLIAQLVMPQTDEEETAQKILATWDGSHAKDGQAPVIFYKVAYHIAQMAMDELAVDDFETFYNTPLMKRSIPLLIANELSPWWDKPATAEKETRKDIINHAFSLSVNELLEQMGAIATWRWGKVHTLEHPHALGRVDFLRPFFNVGTFEQASGDEVLNKLGFKRDGSGMYPITTAPSTRRIIDFADVENSISILPSGQSGNPFSEHYDDQAAMYAEGKWRKMMMNEEEIKTKAKSTLVFKKVSQ